MKWFLLAFLLSSSLLTITFVEGAFALTTEIRVVNPETGDTNFEFYTNTTLLGTCFNVTVYIYNVTDLQTFQVCFKYNSTVLNATRAWMPENDTEYVFYGESSESFGPFFYYDDLMYGTSVLVGGSILGAHGFDGTGLVTIIEFEIIKRPYVGEAFSCSLNINNIHSFLYNSQLNEIEATRTSGYYQYIWRERIRVHNLDTRLNYTAIQEAIDANETDDGHTIFVEEGIYYEKVIVSKSLSLHGENRQNTIINGENTGNVVTINRDNVNITGFTLQESGIPDAGVKLNNVTHCKISENNIANNNGGGIELHEASNNNIISGNNIANNNYGIRFSTLTHTSSNNIIYHNNFMNNTQHVSGLNSTNTWDDGYPSGGNYWSNYTGVDLDPDAIGDSHHIIDEYNIDYYPLMGMFSDFKATSELHVQTICNSSITDFKFNGTAILFNVSGEDESIGFCRICIPKALMNNTFQVYVNGTQTPYTPLTDIFNTTHSYIYFSYSHSTQEVIVIPEFPTFSIILPSIIIAILLTVAVYKRRKL